VRERLRGARRARRQFKPLDAIADPIGSVDCLPGDLSAQKKTVRSKASNNGWNRAQRLSG
jgi:hypothetical protein